MNIGTTFANISGETLIVTATHPDGWREPRIEFTNRDRQTRSFYTPSEVEYLRRTKCLRLVSRGLDAASKAA